MSPHQSLVEALHLLSRDQRDAEVVSDRSRRDTTFKLVHDAVTYYVRKAGSGGPRRPLHEMKSVMDQLRSQCSDNCLLLVIDVAFST